MKMLLKSSWLLALLATNVAASLEWGFPGLSAGEGNPHDNLNKLKIIIYETGDYSTSLRTFLDTAEKYGVESFVVGQGSTFSGFGSKYGQLKDTLDEIQNDADALVAVIDGRDVLLNVNQSVGSDKFDLRVDNFIENFKEMVDGKPQAVLMSAEQQCCVSALCHADSPSYYFDPLTGKRAHRACPSGEAGCGWVDNSNVKFWESLMLAEAYSNTGAQEISPYLNAGMMVGTAQNLIDMIDRMDLGEEEDDQAVLSAMYIQFPHLIALDYEQKLLGNNAWPKGIEEGCIYNFDPEIEDQSYLINTQTGTSPLIVHTPGKFYDCLDTLIERLGGVSDKRYTHVATQRALNYNYGPGNYNYGDNYRSGNYNYGDNYKPGNYNYGGNYKPINYGVVPSAAPAKAPESPENEPEDEPELEDLARLNKEGEEEDDDNNSALAWGFSCAAAAAVIAGLASKKRKTMTEDQERNLKRAMENSNEAFSIADRDPEFLDDEPSVVSSAVDSAADPDEMDFQALEDSTKQPMNASGSFEEIPMGDQKGQKSMIPGSAFDCDDICGRRPAPAEDLRRHRTVHW